MKKLSLSFRALRKLGIVRNEEKYGNRFFLVIIWLVFITLSQIAFKRLAYKYAYSGLLFERTNYMWLRAWLWRKIGVHVGENVRIYQRVALDIGNPDKIFIEDNVSLTNGCTLLCHRRNLDGYRVGDCILDLPYIYGDIHLKKGCFIGMNTMILPGVTVGEGAFVCACSVVSKDVPPWTIVAGAPARVVHRIPTKEEQPKQKQGGGQLDNIKVFSLSGYGRILRRAT